MNKYLPRRSLNKGFTLVELMVVIAIIAILATVSLVIFSNSQASGRDSRRRQDIDALSTAMETHWNPATSSYPALDDANIQAFFADKKLPVDPVNVDTPEKSYVYYLNGSALAAQALGTTNTTYVFCAHLEKGGGNYADKSGTDSGTDYYCKRNQQQ